MITVFATQGTGGNEEARIRDLVSQHAHSLFPFDRKAKLRSFAKLLRTIVRERPELVVMEGTGTAGGVAVLLASALVGTRFVVSSGDAVGPWVGQQYPALLPLFAAYEHLLCKRSAGFIGWTPYLTGRALSFGARRAMTAAGWAPFAQTESAAKEERARIRAQLRIPSNALVIGIAGSLAWNHRVGFCYGYEIGRALSLCKREDVFGIVVGEGPGRLEIERAAGAAGSRLRLVGRVPQSEVPSYLAAMDLASLPQSVDKVGSFRYTTKVSEYLGAQLPIVTGQIPLSYDWSGEWILRLPGDAPWEVKYLRALAELLDGMTPSRLQQARAAVPAHLAEFDRERQIRRATEFFRDLLEERRGRSCESSQP